MKIFLTKGKGKGETEISAFDAALYNAGIHNYNLIRLSSVIPPNTEVLINKKPSVSEDEYGQRLYLVLAEKRSRESGKYIGAALGWYQIPNSDGRGVFVEHEEAGETREAVEANLNEEVRKSLTNLCQLRGYPVIPQRMKIEVSTAKVTNSPVCVLVAATYKSEPW